MADGHRRFTTVVFPRTCFRLCFIASVGMPSLCLQAEVRSCCIRTLKARQPRQLSKPLCTCQAELLGHLSSMLLEAGSSKAWVKTTTGRTGPNPLMVCCTTQVNFVTAVSHVGTSFNRAPFTWLILPVSWFFSGLKTTLCSFSWHQPVAVGAKLHGAR